MSQIPVGCGQRVTSLSEQEYHQMMIHHFGGTKKAATTGLLGLWIFISFMMAITATPIICGILYMIIGDWFIHNMKFVVTSTWLISTIFAIALDTQNGDTQLNMNVIRK